MVDVIGRAKVIITGDVDSTSIDKAGSRIGSSLKAGATIGAAALGTLAVAGFKAFKAFEEAESVSNKLSNVLDNMGKGGAADELEALASTLQRTTGVSDETIKSGQTLLATFDAVAASAGETGGTFERATRASVDMAAVFGSVESGARVLGKALSDPEKAAALLRRSNVILNEEQKTLIDNFLKAGDAAGAQDVILSALEDRYAGTAEAASKETTKISEAFGELQESTGNLITALAGDGEGKKGGGLSGAIFDVSDALNETAESEAWGDLGKDLRNTGSDVGKLTVGLFDLDKKIGKTILKLPGFGDALKDLFDPTHGFTDLVLDLVDAVKNLNGEMEGDGGLVLLNENNTDFGESDFVGQIKGSAGGGRIGSGFRLVGENGPELISMGSGGGYVHNNSETRRMIGSADTGGNTTTLVFNGPANLSEARRRAQWQNDYGTRFGGATSVGAQ
jgi:hypothetical protein